MVCTCQLVSIPQTFATYITGELAGNSIDLKLCTLINISMKMIPFAPQVSWSRSRPFSTLLPRGVLMFCKHLLLCCC